MIRGGAKNDRFLREKEKQKHGRVQEQTAKVLEIVLCDEDDTKMLQILAWEC